MAKTGSGKKGARGRTPSRKTRKAAKSTAARRRSTPGETGGKARARSSAEGREPVKGATAVGIAKQTHRGRVRAPKTVGRAAVAPARGG
jgi:hypothetical protein